MALSGKWQEFFELMAEALREQTSVRDYMKGEKVIQGFLLAYLNVTDYFIVSSEKELNKGYCDIYLEPFVEAYKEVEHGYLIELKYVKRGDFSKEFLSETIEQAKGQLAQYRQDPSLARVGKHIHWNSLVLVFHGWELTHFESCL